MTLTTFLAGVHPLIYILTQLKAAIYPLIGSFLHHIILVVT